MSTKKKLTVLAALIACISILALGSIAYFTAQDTANNQITAGNLAIDIRETDGEGNPFENQTGIMPGDTVAKVVDVQNVGTGTAWIRVNVVMTCTDYTGQELSLEGITLDYNTTDWIYQDGYYYYNAPVAAGAFTTALFENVSFSIDLGNEYMNATLNIDVNAQAVQSANNGATVLEAQGWPAE